MIAQLSDPIGTNMPIAGLFLAVAILNAIISTMMKKNAFVKLSSKHIFALATLFLASFCSLFFLLNLPSFTESMLYFSATYDNFLSGKYHTITQFSPNQLVLIAVMITTGASIAEYTIFTFNMCFMVGGLLLLLLTSHHVLARHETRATLKRSFLVTLTSVAAVQFFSDTDYLNAAAFFLLCAAVYAVVTKKYTVAGIVLGIGIFYSLDFAILLVGIAYSMNRMKEPALLRLALPTMILVTSFTLAWLFRPASYYMLITLTYFFPTRIIPKYNPPRITILNILLESYTNWPVYMFAIPVSAIIIAIAYKRRPFLRTSREANIAGVVPGAVLLPLILQVSYVTSTMLPVMVMLCLTASDGKKRDFLPFVHYINMFIILEYVVLMLVPNWYSYYALIEAAVMIPVLVRYALAPVDMDCRQNGILTVQTQSQ